MEQHAIELLASYAQLRLSLFGISSPSRPEVADAVSAAFQGMPLDARDRDIGAPERVFDLVCAKLAVPEVSA